MLYLHQMASIVINLDSRKLNRKRTELTNQKSKTLKLLCNKRDQIMLQGGHFVD